MNVRTLLLATVVSGSLIGLASAAPITLAPPFLILSDRGPNDIGIPSGTFISVGDTSVVPNGGGGTTATAETTNLSTGAIFTASVPWLGLTAAPNQFENSVPENVNLFGPWTLNFTNGTNTASVTTGSISGPGVVPPFASNVTLSGVSTNPTFSWTYPSGSVNGVLINIYDKSLPTATGGPDLVYTSAILPPTTTSFTVPTALAGGLTLQLNHDYTINFKGVTLRNPAGPLTDSNTAGWSQVYFDFTPLPTGSPVVNLPTILPSGAYQYSMTVIGGQTYFVDPTVAIGYSFAIGAGDPNFASVLLPAVQTNPYDVSFLYNGMGFSDMVAPETVFDFPTGGVDAFTVTGIDPSDGLDPGDTTAFITGLTFVSDGTFTGTQTPITEEVVAAPEPSSLTLLGTRLLGWRLLRRRRQVCNPA